MLRSSSLPLACSSHGGPLPFLPSFLPFPAQQAASLSLEDMGAALLEHNVACPHCGKETLTKPTVFNLMFQTQVGPASTTA